MNNEFVSIPDFYEFADASTTLKDILTFSTIKSFVNPETGNCNPKIAELCQGLQISRADLDYTLIGLGQFFSYVPQGQSIAFKILNEGDEVMIPKELFNAPLSKPEKALLIAFKMLESGDMTLPLAMGIIEMNFEFSIESLASMTFDLIAKDYLIPYELDESEEEGYIFSDKLNWYFKESSIQKVSL